MKMLAVYAADNGGNARQPKNGEPCVPNFGVCGQHMFVGLETDGLATNATPAVFPDATVDKLFEEYKKRYPSIPEPMLEKYFFASADAAVKFPDGQRVKVQHLDDGTARLYSPESGTTMEVRLE
jgi:hypothetical protein